MVLDAYTTIVAEFKKRSIGPEILEWITGPGKKAFIEKCLTPLGDAYREYLRVKKGDEKPKLITAEVDLDADPVAPFDGAMLTKHTKQGKSIVEYRPDEDELYVNGRRLVPFLSEKQLGGKTVRGKDLQAEAETNNPTNATLADVLYEHQEFIPKKFRDRVWFFWATEWSDSDRDRCVRCLDWSGARWHRHCRWLDDGWDGGSPSASLAS